MEFGLLNRLNHISFEQNKQFNIRLSELYQKTFIFYIQWFHTIKKFVPVRVLTTTVVISNDICNGNILSIGAQVVNDLNS